MSEQALRAASSASATSAATMRESCRRSKAPGWKRSSTSMNPGRGRLPPRPASGADERARTRRAGRPRVDRHAHETHAEIAGLFLEQGIPVLVEKPLARSVAEADAIIAAQRGPAPRWRWGTPSASTRRSWPPGPRSDHPRSSRSTGRDLPERSLDIDVVFDLIDPRPRPRALDRPVRGRVRSRPSACRCSPIGRHRECAAAFRVGLAWPTSRRAGISRDRTRKIRFLPARCVHFNRHRAKTAEVYRLVRPADRRPAIEGGKIPVPEGEPSARAPGLRGRGQFGARHSWRGGRPGAVALAAESRNGWRMHTDLKAFIDDLDPARLAQAGDRAREPRPRDGSGHRPGEQVAGRRSGTPLRQAVGSACRWRRTCSGRSTACAWRWA